MAMGDLEYESWFIISISYDGCVLFKGPVAGSKIKLTNVPG